MTHLIYENFFFFREIKEKFTLSLNIQVFILTYRVGEIL